VAFQRALLSPGTGKPTFLVMIEPFG